MIATRYGIWQLFPLKRMTTACPEDQMDIYFWQIRRPENSARLLSPKEKQPSADRISHSTTSLPSIGIPQPISSHNGPAKDRQTKGPQAKNHQIKDKPQQLPCAEAFGPKM